MASPHPTAPNTTDTSPLDPDLFSPCTSPTCTLCNPSSENNNHPSTPVIMASTPSTETENSTTPSSPAWSIVSSTPISPSLTTLPFLPTIPPDNETSPLISTLMNSARALASSSNPPTLPPLPPPTPLTLDFHERVDTAIAASSNLLSEARAQLAAPIVARKELTESEKFELSREKAWDHAYAQRKLVIEEQEKRNQKLFEEVMGGFDEMEKEGGAVAGPSDWKGKGLEGGRKGNGQKGVLARKGKGAEGMKRDLEWQNVFRLEGKVSW